MINEDNLKHYSIDNYCDHESDEIRYANEFYEPHKGNNVAYKCIKCGEMYE